MKAEELRIGNYFKPDSFDRKEFDFEAITANQIQDFATDPQDDFYKPIPLTEKWLIKFGFKKTYPDGEDDFPWWDLNHVEFIDYGDELEYCTTCRTFLYVHQLQNLYFALTNEELKLK